MSSASQSGVGASVVVDGSFAASPYAKPSALDARRCARRVLQDLTSASEAAKV